MSKGSDDLRSIIERAKREHAIERGPVKVRESRKEARAKLFEKIATEARLKGDDAKADAYEKRAIEKRKE
jgi:hypothetical protein